MFKIHGCSRNVNRGKTWTKRCIRCGENFTGAAGSQRPTCPKHTPGAFITASMRWVLERLASSEYPDNEIVCGGLDCWVGDQRTNWQTVNKLLQIIAISDVSDENGGARRYVINESGRHYLKDEALVYDVLKAVHEGSGAWTWRDNKLVPL
jgi:hypothetical protein